MRVRSKTKRNHEFIKWYQNTKWNCTGFETGDLIKDARDWNWMKEAIDYW